MNGKTTAPPDDDCAVCPGCRAVLMVELAVASAAALGASEGAILAAVNDALDEAFGLGADSPAPGEA